MSPENVLSHPPRVLSDAQRHFYFLNGYLLLESLVPADTLARLREIVAGFVERSRALTCSDEVLDLEDGHTAAAPRLRRLSSPVAHHPYFWEFASGLVADVAADLVGPDVKFHHSKLNFKWAGGGTGIRWHQDITGWPHTNYSPLTIGVYLEDVGPEQGPLGVIPGSHNGELFEPYDEAGNYTGCLSASALQRAGVERAVYLTGPAGSITIHNCRMLHSSKPNLAGRGRPLLLNVYSAADAFPYTINQLPTRYAGAIVRGRPARWSHHDPRPCALPLRESERPLVTSGIFEIAAPAQPRAVQSD